MKKEVSGGSSLGRKFGYFCLFILVVYLLILSLVLVKDSAAEFGSGIFKITIANVSLLNALGIGWLAAILLQSSGAATSLLATLSAAGILGSVVLVYSVVGTRIGTSVTALLVSLFVKGKRRDFRHGFEIALANLLYAVPVALFMILTEFFFHPFSRFETYFLALDGRFGYNPLDFLTNWFIERVQFIPSYLLFVLGFVLFILSINLIPKVLVSFYGGERAVKLINKSLDNRWRAFFTGVLITSLTLSTSVAVILIIPIVAMRIINLKKAIPYIIGANFAGITEAIFLALVIGKQSFPAFFIYISFSILGLLWLFNTNALFNATKYISKRVVHVSRKRAALFVLIFILAAILVAII